MSVGEVAKRKASSSLPAPALAADEGFDGRDVHGAPKNPKKKTRFNRQHDPDSGELWGDMDEQNPEELPEEDFWAGPLTTPRDPYIECPGSAPPPTPDDLFYRAERLLEEARVLFQNVGSRLWRRRVWRVAVGVCGGGP